MSLVTAKQYIPLYKKRFDSPSSNQKIIHLAVAGRWNIYRAIPAVLSTQRKVNKSELFITGGLVVKVSEFWSSVNNQFIEPVFLNRIEAAFLSSFA